MEGENIIIFSSDDWSSGLKTSKYHVARELARRNRVLFVNSVGLRAPTASGRDLGRALNKLKSFFRGPVRVPEGLWVYTPVVVPFARGSGLVRLSNGILLRAALRWLQARLDLTRPVVFSFIPTFNELIGYLREKVTVYYCIDELRGYSGVDRNWFDREEDRLLSMADCAICSSEALAVNFRDRGSEAHYVPHGVQWPIFRRAVTEDLPEPEDLQGIPHPRLGFYGFLSDEWVDYDLLKAMASRQPDWHIVLIGRPRAGMDMESLIPEPNIHCLGLKPFESLPAYTRHFDVGLIPFNRNELTAHSNPLKLLEYLSGGLPVVSTDIPEVRKYCELVHIGCTVDEFVDLCANALQDNDLKSRHNRSLAVQKHSWTERIDAVSQILKRATGSGCT